jgi:hypothetical protein
LASKDDIHHDVWAAFALLRRVARPAVMLFEDLDRVEQALGHSAILDRLITPPDPRGVLAELLRTDGGDSAAPGAHRDHTPSDILPQWRSKPTLLPDPKNAAPIARLLAERDLGSLDVGHMQSSKSATFGTARRSLKAADQKPMSLKQIAEIRLSHRRKSLKQTSEGSATSLPAPKEQNEKIIPLSQKAKASGAKPPARPERHPLDQLAVRSNRTLDLPETSREHLVGLAADKLLHTATGKRADGPLSNKVTKTVTAPDRIKVSGAQKTAQKYALSNKPAKPTPVPLMPSKSQMKATPPDRLNSTSPRLSDEQQALEEEAWRSGGA